MNVIDFLISIDGLAELQAYDGQFLGMISSDRNAPLSIFNPSGNYGSSYSLTSIFNSMCFYGSRVGMYSAYNPNSLNPPFIVREGSIVAFLTKNTDLLANGIPTLDPDFVSSVYAQSSHRAVGHDLVTAYAKMRRTNSRLLASLMPDPPSY
jgi:hypothetical protein